MRYGEEIPMRKTRGIVLLTVCIMIIGLFLACGCGNSNTNNDSTENIAVDTESSDVDEVTTEEEVVVEDTENEPETEQELSDSQKNSIAMLNYLATLSQEINESKNSRMFLEEAYAALINNTNPERVNELTESHLSSLLDIIEKYRLINVKRERLQYIYDQNKAMAIKEAVPNPIAVLSAAQSFDLKGLATSVIYMAVDSVSSYQSYNNEIDNEFLQDGWVLDDEEAANLHDSRKRAFMFMIEIVREEKLPGELALSESAVENFVKWKNNDNVYQRLQFLESEVEVYKAFGNYWLELVGSYYETGEYKKCLESVEKYEELQTEIFRKDYYLAQIIPKVIVSASECYTGEEYVFVAEKYLQILMENTENSEWSLRYFAAQTYLDLYAKTNDLKYMQKAYDITLNNVNYLVGEQESINNIYLANVNEVTVPSDATKDEKKQIKEYNKSLKNARKTELPQIYEPLALNCDLLFALADEINISNSEKVKINAILNEAFLSIPYKNRYSFNTNLPVLEITFNTTEIIMPATMLTEKSEVKVVVTDGVKEYEYTEWIVKAVDRKDTSIETFEVLVKCDAIKKQEWSAESEVRIEIYDGNNHEPIVIKFKVSEYKEGFLFLGDTLKFEQVK